jgi:hypothetical protein
MRDEEGEEGCAGREGPSRPPPPPAERGGGPRRGGGGAGGEGATTGEGEGREREALHGRENEETLGTTMELSHLGRRPSPEPRRKSSIDEDSRVRLTNRTRPDESLDEMNTLVSSDSTDNGQIGSNCSPKLSPELEPLRISASNSES